jgi:hypothetical protein
MTANYQWTNKTAFGYNETSGQLTWNDMGTNSTIYKMMSWAKQRYASTYSSSYGISADVAGTQPTYFLDDQNGGYFAGLELDPATAYQQYGGLIPMVCLYKIDWQKYYNATAQP